jgi:hypothetical protein
VVGRGRDGEVWAMSMIMVIPELVRSVGKAVAEQSRMLPTEAAVQREFVGAKVEDCPGVAPVTRVLEQGPAVFTALRDELRDLLEEAATAFAEAADILEAVDEQASAEVGTLLERVDKATATGDASGPGVGSTADGRDAKTGL